MSTGERDLGRVADAVPRAQRLHRGDASTPSPTARCSTTTASVAGMLCVVKEDTEEVIAAPPDADPARPRLPARLQPDRGGDDLHRLPASSPAARPTCRSRWSTCSTTTAATARLAGSTGFDRDAPGGAGPDRRRAARSTVWPAAGALRGETAARGATSRTGSSSCPPARGTVPPAAGARRPARRQRRRRGPTASRSSALNRFRPLDDGYRDFCDLVAGQLAASLTDARAYEFEQRPRRDARRARPGQDRLLHQRQPRVPHPADAAARPGRGRPHRRGRPAVRTRSATGSR